MVHGELAGVAYTVDGANRCYSNYEPRCTRRFLVYKRRRPRSSHIGLDSVDDTGSTWLREASETERSKPGDTTGWPSRPQGHEARAAPSAMATHGLFPGRRQRQSASDGTSDHHTARSHKHIPVEPNSRAAFSVWPRHHSLDNQSHTHRSCRSD